MWPRHIHEYMLEFLVYVLTMSGLELVLVWTLTLVRTVRKSKICSLKSQSMKQEIPKGGFFSESAIRLFKSPNLQKKYSKKLS